jgi:hypothetical protein
MLTELKPEFLIKSMTNLNTKLFIFSSAFVASIVLGGTAQALNLSFTQTGSQLDKDPILDIAIGSNQTIDFKVSFDPAGVSKTIDSLTYIVDFDPSELQFVGMTGSVSQGPSGTNRISPLGINLGIPANSSAEIITTLRFETVNPGPWPHDGMFDFKISTASGKFSDNTLIPNIFTYGPKKDSFSQEVEVQQVPEPLTILGTLLAGGIGVAMKKKKDALQQSES